MLALLASILLAANPRMVPTVPMAPGASEGVKGNAIHWRLVMEVVYEGKIIGRFPLDGNYYLTEKSCEDAGAAFPTPVAPAQMPKFHHYICAPYHAGEDDDYTTPSP